MERQHMKIKLAKKDMERLSRKAKKEEAECKTKIKKAIEDQDYEIAKIHGESAIRKRSESVRMLRLAARMDCVASKLMSAIKTKNMSKTMKTLVAGLDRALDSNDMADIAAIMERFVEQDDEIEKISSTVGSAIEETTKKETKQSDVDELIAKVAEEHGLEISMKLETGEKKEKTQDRLSRLKHV
ncbi:MAG: ESCRT III complex subunit Did2 [Amphiamblys sp. WSBS2006]|nr:MAG: ESCRT III complex subunit Did2 [Amphiamblys sp. WSBS2006]